MKLPIGAGRGAGPLDNSAAGFAHRPWLPGILGMVLWGWILLAVAQERQERDGVVLYWGLVPAEIVSQRHDLDEMHGGRPPGGGKINHLVLALFDAKSGRRIDDAVIRAQLTEPGVVDAPARYVPPMAVNGVASYGQLFGMVRDGPYRFRIFVKLADRREEIEFPVSTSAQLAPR